MIHPFIALDYTINDDLKAGQTSPQKLPRKIRFVSVPDLNRLLAI